MFLNFKNHNGFAALFTIVVISAAALIMAQSAVFLGLGELDMGFVSQKGEEAFYVADGCMEETLRRIKMDTNYGVGTGTINLAISNGACEINVTDLGSNQRQVVVVGVTTNYNKSLLAVLTLNGNEIILSSWEELSI